MKLVRNDIYWVWSKAWKTFNVGQWTGAGWYVIGNEVEFPPKRFEAFKRIPKPRKKSSTN